MSLVLLLVLMDVSTLLEVWEAPTSKVKYNASLCLKTAERYNPETGQWEEIAQMAEGRRSHATVTMPDGVYALGGFNGSKYLNSVEK